MQITTSKQTHTIDGATVTFRRTTGGVIELWADDDTSLARAMGFVHAHDRQVQLNLVRLVGQGRLSECLAPDEDTLAIDIFMRHMGFAHTAKQEAAKCSDVARELGDAYCSGVNAYLGRHATAVDFRLLGYHPEPWRIADILLTLKLMSYIGLAQTQGDMEKFLIQAVKGGADVDTLKNIFAPHLDGLTPEIVEAIESVHIYEPLVPASTFIGAAPSLRASNNWAVAGSRTQSGSPFQCNDPHLECNRLPAIWYEFVAHVGDDYRIGINMPGVPGLVMGRTSTISTGFTYGFMDMVDYFLEKISGGTCDYAPFTRREEVVKRKKKEPVVLSIWENEHGVLEVDPRLNAIPDGLHLCRAYSAHSTGAAESLEALAELPKATSVDAAQDVVRNISISCNWLIADRDGNIGYQQSGNLPARAHSGVHPVLGWNPDSAWRGLVDPAQLTRTSNPASGILVTANADHNNPDGPLSINLFQGPYRQQRITELLDEKDTLTLEDMEHIQADVVSIQARHFMKLISPLLPDTPAGRLLADWDLRYDTASKGATLFEEIYTALLEEVFGAGLFGRDAWRTQWSTTNLMDDYFYYFDQALLAEDRTAVLESIVAKVAPPTRDPSTIPTWGAGRGVKMENILFAGKLPGFTRVDRGPVHLPGCRATVVQGGIFQSHGRLTTFYPSYRFITDLGRDDARTALAGGPSGRAWSKWYASDVKRWMAFEYKTLSAT